MNEITKEEYDLAIVAVRHDSISDMHYNARMTINLEEYI
jgi:hypothetical protein